MELTPINIIKLYQKYDTGRTRYLLIKPSLISRIIWVEVIQEDLTWPTIIDIKIKTISLSNENHDGPAQYKELDQIDVKRKIEKDKGSKFYINEKEVRARDAQMFFADLSTGAHSPSMISQGRIGALVTAKPNSKKSLLNNLDKEYPSMCWGLERFQGWEAGEEKKELSKNASLIPVLIQ